MICKSCDSAITNHRDHTPMLCLRAQERRRVMKGEKCPQCGGIAFHEAKCSLWNAFRLAKVT